jgi:hypothetical protein
MSLVPYATPARVAYLWGGVKILFPWHTVRAASKWPTFTFLRIPSRAAIVRLSCIRLCEVDRYVVTSRRCDRDRSMILFTALLLLFIRKKNLPSVPEIFVPILVGQKLLNFMVLSPS